MEEDTASPSARTNFRADPLTELDLRCVIRAIKKGYTDTLMGGEDHLDAAKGRLREALADGRFKPVKVMVDDRLLGFVGLPPCQEILLTRENFWNVLEVGPDVIRVASRGIGPPQEAFSVSILENGGDLSVPRPFGEVEAAIEEVRCLAG